MALTYTTYAPDLGSAADPATVTTTSRSYNAGDMVTIAFVGPDQQQAVTPSCTNTGTAQTWSQIAEIDIASQCYIVIFRCVMTVTQTMTITVSADIGISNPFISRGFVIVENGQHASDPVPSGNVFSGSAGTDVSQSITPTAVGSNLWMFLGDWNATNTFAAAANCTLERSDHSAGDMTSALVRPTTQPRGDASAFTIGETDTGGSNAWVAWEVQAAVDSWTPQTNAPETLQLIAAPRW